MCELDWSIGGTVGFGGTGDRDDTFGLYRVNLHADLHAADAVRFFVEGKSALTSYNDLPGGKRTLDEDCLDLEQLFADVAVPLGDHWRLTLRPGRQKFQFGRQRLVSHLPWANTMRRWEGISAILDTDSGWRMHTFWSQFVPVKKYDFNRADGQTEFWGVYANGPLPAVGDGLDVYLLGLNRRDRVLFNGSAGSEDRFTMGGRLWGQIASSDFDFDAEGAYQFGEVGSSDISAFMFATEVGFRPGGEPTAPRVHIGFDYASGDDNAGGDVETFNQLFPLGHAYLGFIDTVGRQNVIDLSTGVTLTPWRNMTVKLTGHQFWRADRADALYHAGGGVVRAGFLGNSRDVGTEVDFLVKYVINRHLTGHAGVSHFFPGTFIEQSGSHGDVSFLYLSIQYTF